jgi:hypothetical protein
VILTEAAYGLIMTPTLVNSADMAACVEVSTTLSDVTETDSDGVSHTYSYTDVTLCTTNNYYDGGSAEGAFITA